MGRRLFRDDFGASGVGEEFFCRDVFANSEGVALVLVGTIAGRSERFDLWWRRKFFVVRSRRLVAI